MDEKDKSVMPGSEPTPMPARMPGSSVRGYGVSDVEERNESQAAPRGMRAMPGMGEGYPEAKRGARVSDISGGGVSGRAQSEAAAGIEAAGAPGESGQGVAADGAGADEELMGYDRQIAALREAAANVRPETAEERAKRERRERSKKRIAAIVDGTSALANLFFTTQYAPNSYNPQSSQLRKVNERIEALKAERQADADRYNNLMVKIGDAENAKAKTLRDMQAQHEAQKMAREKAQRDAEAHSWLAVLQDDKRREQKGKADRAESEAAAAQAEAESAPAMQKAKLETEQARRGSYEASAGASRASAANSYASAASHKSKSIYGTFRGKTYDNQRDYDKAVRKAAEEYNKRNPIVKKETQQVQEDGKWVDAEVEVTKDPVELTWKTKDGEPRYYEASVIAAKLEPLLKEEEATSDTPPSRRGKAAGGDDNTPPSMRKR